MTALLGFIPSPSSGVVKLGPLTIHLYGVTLLVAILACIWLTSVRWKKLGGESDFVIRVAVWGVALGIVGARAYHDITSWNQVPDPKWKGVFEIWEGGLGIWGGILLGTLAGAVIIRGAGYSATTFMDVAAPGMLLAQGIGRVGNWWNQELYGKPTTLPWGLEINLAHRAGLAPQYLNAKAYQPTFLYELLWDLAGVGLLLLVSRRTKLYPPALFSLYVAYYCFGRFFEELLRIDPSHYWYGLRLNAWVSIVCFAGSLGFFIWWQLLGHGDPERRPPPRTPARVEPAGGPQMAIPRGRVRPRR